MHILQPKHTKLNKNEVEKLLSELNISPVQLPKIKINDIGLPEGCEIGDLVRVERISDGKKLVYYRVIVV